MAQTHFILAVQKNHHQTALDIEERAQCLRMAITWSNVLDKSQSCHWRGHEM